MIARTSNRISLVGGVLAGALILVGTLPAAAAAQDVDSRWLPWLGCWEASDGGTEVPMLCIRPLAAEEGVELTTFADGELISTETIHSDGLPRQTTREECVGEEEARFSDDGRRIYLRSDYVCEGGVGRSATGLLAFANPMEWLDIKVVDVAGERVPMVLRYRPARAERIEAAGMEGVVAPRAMAVKAARIGASARLGPEDLIEAAGKVDGKALEALIVERGDPFNVDADMLIRLADAGVPEEVIDLAVAVSFPGKFAVGSGAPEELRAEKTAYGVSMAPYSFGFHWSFWNPYYYDPFYSSPWGGYYGGYYGSGWYGGYYRPVNVVVRPRPPVPVEHGRVVNGRGYSRGRSGGGGGSTSPSTRAAPTGRSSSGSVGSSGARRGSSSGSTGRTAKRRGGGGF